MVLFFSRLKLPRSFDRDLTLLMFSMSARRIGMGFLQVVRVIYFALLGFSPVEIGFLLSIATFVSAIHHVTFGMLSDRYGRKIFFILGGIFATMRMVIFALSSDFWMLALGQGVGAMGEGAGAGQPVVSGYIADKTDMRNRPSTFSTLAVTNALAATIGSLLAGLPKWFQITLGADNIASHALLFWIGAAGCIGSLLFIFPMEDVKAVAVEDVVEKDVVDAPRKSSWSVIVKFSLVRSTSGLGWGFIESLMPLYFFMRFGLGGEFLGPIYAAARLMSVFSYMLIPRFVDHFGEIQTIVLSRFLTALLTFVFSITPWMLLAVIIMVTLRIVIMFTMPIRQSFATGIVRPEETATAIGISNFARMSFRTVAPTVAGYMFETISFSMPFITGATFLIVNGLLFRAFFQPKNEI
jgi:DHA1 family multidrug resistance protein-like MFS transporter